jgi:hypothetical protein
LQPPVKITLALTGYLRKPSVETTFTLTVFLIQSHVEIILALAGGVRKNQEKKKITKGGFFKPTPGGFTTPPRHC